MKIVVDRIIRIYTLALQRLAAAELLEPNPDQETLCLGDPGAADQQPAADQPLHRSVTNSASKSSVQRFVITEKAPTGAFSWLKAATTAFTFKTLLRHYAKRALTPRSLNGKLGPRREGHKGQQFG